MVISKKKLRDGLLAEIRKYEEGQVSKVVQEGKEKVAEEAVVSDSTV